MNWLLVALGAAVGAPLRHLTDRAVQPWHDWVFPWGTLTVNDTASLVLGVLTGSVAAGGAGSNLQLPVGTGLCGGLSTCSTFSYETLAPAETRAGLPAVGNVAAHVPGGLGAAFAGRDPARVVRA